jgi:hypothetical protein
VIRKLNGILGGSEKYQRSHRRVNRREPGIGGEYAQKTHGRGNFEGDWKELPWIVVTGRTMRSNRMLIAAIFPGIPFPHLDDWIICMTSLDRWFSNVMNGLINRKFSQDLLFLFH